MIRVVRTSTAEVDRRTSERRRVDLPCRITIDQRTQPGRVVDLSETGAQVRAYATYQGAPAACS